ncbi:MAG: SDR family NAD(P)-dependent oxidoreductase [Polyangiaceae bacterium]
MLLTGICALVTGETSGLGRAMAQALANAGARVAITSRDGARAETTAAEIGRAAIGVELDVRDVLSVNRRVDEVYGALKGLDQSHAVQGVGRKLTTGEASSAAAARTRKNRTSFPSSCCATEPTFTVGADRIDRGPSPSPTP